MAGQVIDKCLDNRVFPFVKESGVKIFFFPQSDVSIMYSEFH